MRDIQVPNLRLNVAWVRDYVGDKPDDQLDQRMIVDSRSHPVPRMKKAASDEAAF